MSNQSQSLESNDRDQPLTTPRSVGEQRFEQALASYRSRFSKGHDDSVREIELAICELVDEMKDDHMGPVEVVLAIKRHLFLHPASISIHAALIQNSIDHYYV